LKVYHVTAPEEIRIQRIISRAGMTAEKIATIMQNQFRIGKRPGDRITLSSMMDSHRFYTGFAASSCFLSNEYPYYLMRKFRANGSALVWDGRSEVHRGILVLRSVLSSTPPTWKSLNTIIRIPPPATL